MVGHNNIKQANSITNLCPPPILCETFSLKLRQLKSNNSSISKDILMTIHVKINFIKGSLTVWALYAYFSDSHNATFEFLVWCM